MCLPISDKTCGALASGPTSTSRTDANGREPPPPALVTFTSTGLRLVTLNRRRPVAPARRMPRSTTRGREAGADDDDDDESASSGLSWSACCCRFVFVVGTGTELAGADLLACVRVRVCAAFVFAVCLSEEQERGGGGGGGGVGRDSGEMRRAFRRAGKKQESVRAKTGESTAKLYGRIQSHQGDPTNERMNERTNERRTTTNPIGHLSGQRETAPPTGKGIVS